MRKLQFLAPLSLALALAASARADPLAVVTTSLPEGAFGVPYSAALSAAGGVSPYVWCGPGFQACPWQQGGISPLEGELPPGLILSTDGVLSGTPKGVGSSSFQVEVQDATGAMALSAFFTIDVPAVGPLLVASNSAPVGEKGQPYRAFLNAAGGKPPYSHDPNADPGSSAGWLVLDTLRAIVSPTDQGDLGAHAPPGLSLDLAGMLSGTPTQTGTFRISVQVTDSSTPTQVAQGVVTLTVITLDEAILRDGLLFQNPALPQATVGDRYQVALQTNASDPALVAFMVVGDEPLTPDGTSLPPGLTLGGDGLLSGVPTAAGFYQFSIIANDDGALVATQAFSLTVVGGSGGCSSVGSDTSVSYGVVLLALAAMNRSRKRR